ncbi:Ig-like domain-containing protein [Geothrix sp. PMB-07]|uniref:Ig-like domain-containing protein n=1 Tax=Geothrix sp. PMB-07 TaxID=3068640 RepID=UPI00274111F1|nr:Ig-like domain-containing protein [Geothrix sp. PMB-07]WLT32521.1 Ig-like domain-containing protein [Geothrix sp. PMB-07]
MTGCCRRIALPCLGLPCLSVFSFVLAAETPTLSGEERSADYRITAAVRAHSELGRGLDERHTIRQQRTVPDATAAVHHRGLQYFQGLRVLGGELILREGHDGSLKATADTLSRGLFIHPQPTLEASEALATAHLQIAPKFGYSAPPSAELVIVPITRLVPRTGVKKAVNAEDFEEVTVGHELAYLVHAEMEQDADTRHEDLLVHAHTGGVIKQWSTLHTAVHDGVGKSEYSGTVTLSTNSLTSGYELRDMRRSSNATVNMAGATSGNGTIYTSTADSWGDGTNFVAGGSTTSANGQTAAVDAHYGMQATWDFYKNVLGRNGIDGTGRTVTSRVHYGSRYDNAFWSDACFCMTYGDGSVLKTLTALDVAGHEMSHGVCATTANLAYYGESGGLNEANSDILGTMVEFYSRGAQGIGTVVPDTGGTWTIGEQLTNPSFPNPLRYMYKPSLDGASPDAWSASLGSLDVHYSSGPMNRAFYFLSQGSSATASSTSYSSYLPAGMKGIGNDKAVRIWWRTLSTRLTSTSNYLAARNGAIASAAELYGAGGAEEAAVWNAFAAINVGSAWKPADTTAPMVSASATGTSGTVTFSATATDNVGVTRVDYYVDGVIKGSATASPYTFAFVSTALANGSHSLVAKAYDAAGNVGTSSTVAFTLNNDFTAPTVAAKVTGTSGTLTFSATAADNVGVTRVDYYVDGVLKGSATASPYTFAFVSTALANGSHSLVAKAYDAAGNVGTSTSVAFTLNNDLTAPNVVAKVTGTSGTLTFSATATDNVGVIRVDYYVDGALKGSSTVSPYNVTFLSTTLTDGNHSLVAKAYDAAGNVGTSATLTFATKNDITAPTVVAKVTGTSGTLSFSATATDNVGVTRVDYYVDGVLKGSATASPYAFAFVSTVLANGSHSLVAKAYDASGNVGTSATVTFTVNNDLIAPTVAAKVTGTSGTLTFSATATDNVGVTRVDYYVDGVLKGSATASPYAFAFVSTALANGNHSLVAKAYDAAGNVGTSATVVFSLSNDLTAPTVVAKVTGTSGTLTFSATAADNVGVTRVEYYVDGVLKGSASASPYNLAFLSTTLIDGNHTLVAKAYDAAGNVGTSAALAFAIKNDNTAPTVAAQVSGTSGTVTFSATATDNVGVTRVDYYVDGALKGSATASPYTFAFDSTTVTNASHSLVAKAYDASGNVGTSATVAFSINNAPPSSVLLETEFNDTVATANVIGSSVTTVIGAISTGTDVDTYALTLTAGQSVQLILMPPPGMYYGIAFPQGLAGQGLVGQPTQSAGGQVITIPAQPRGLAQMTVYLQVYSLTQQGSSAKYTLSIKR